ncbi:alpha/beta fold hydrolase [Bacillus sp. USDA818B3_A]|uniref:alpha/beta fold hydrolase n=1 Tax=Bacillus sp. USDA818B3_A TaxID=2698834 RepID=UPI001924A85D|nr:hypothetical protein [Bacillus sp. USDA818B3_A]
MTHLSANLDNWDPRIIDGLAKSHWVIVFNNLRVGLSNGKVPNNIPQMANDAITFIKLLGLGRFDSFVNGRNDCSRINLKGTKLS